MRAVRILGGILALLFVIWALLWITKGRFLKGPFETIASAQAGRPVKVAGDFQLYFNPHLKFLAEGLSVANPAWAVDNQLVEAGRIHVEIRTLPLLVGRTRIRFLEIEDGDIALEWNARQQNSWTFGERTGEPLDIPPITRANIRNTRISYRDPALQLVADIRIDSIAAREGELPERIDFIGKGVSHAAPFTLSGALLAPGDTLAGADNRLAGRLDMADNRIDFSGRMHGVFDLEGADVALRLRGDNFATPFTLLGLTIPATRRYDISGNLTRNGGTWRFSAIKGRFGDSDLTGDATFSFPGERLLSKPICTAIIWLCSILRHGSG